ncbi:unnamed protein product, partial [Effrenium voratum]
MGAVLSHCPSRRHLPDVKSYHEKKILSLACGIFELPSHLESSLGLQQLGLSARPETNAQVELHLWCRKFWEAGHDAPEVYCCTKPSMNGAAKQELCLAAFRVFAPSVASMPLLQQRRVEHVYPQSGFSSRTAVVDWMGFDSTGNMLQYRAVADVQLQGKSVQQPDSADRLITVVLAGTQSPTQDESLSCLIEMFGEIFIQMCSYSAGNVVQQASPPSLKLDAGDEEQVSFRLVPYLGLIMNNLPGDMLEFAFLARSFELGYAGYPPTGSCGSPLCRLHLHQQGDVLALYSCLIGNAPRTCCGEMKARAEPEHFMGFVKADGIPRDHLQGGEMFAAEVASRPLPVAQPGAPESSGCSLGNTIKLQRIRSCLHRICDVEVDVQELRFTQNTISSKFRDGRSVRALAEELRCDR